MKNRSQEQVLREAENLRKSVAILRPADVDLTISIGLASMEGHPDLNLTQLLALADKALYQSKENGRNRVSYFQDEEIKLSPLHE